MCVCIFTYYFYEHLFNTQFLCVFWSFFPVFPNGMDESIRYRQSGNKQKHTNFAHIDVV